tara:strand:+ start:391 stop:627 length:237 start_codon:yes stop_codon:yes gene_type:complete
MNKIDSMGEAGIREANMAKKLLKLRKKKPKQLELRRKMLRVLQKKRKSMLISEDLDILCVEGKMVILRITLKKRMLIN